MELKITLADGATVRTIRAVKVWARTSADDTMRADKRDRGVQVIAAHLVSIVRSSTKPWGLYVKRGSNLVRITNVEEV